MVYHIFYKTTNIINGKYYYGVHSTHNLDDGYVGSGTRLARAIKKYGKENFTREILAIFDTKEEAFLIEKSVVTRDLVYDDNCYNIKIGGQAGHKTFKTAQSRSEDKNIDREKYLTQKLKGENRTELQKISAKQHSERSKGKTPPNKRQISLFGTTYESVTSAIKDQGISTGQYYFMLNSNIEFGSADELKSYTWDLRNSKIRKARWNRE